MVGISEISLEKICLNEKKRATIIVLVGRAGSAAVVRWIPRLLPRLVVKTQSPHSTTWFGSEDVDPILLEKETGPSSRLG